VTKLVALLLEYLLITRNRVLPSQQLQSMAHNNTTAAAAAAAAASHQVPSLYGLRGQAVQMLEYLATACPSTLVALDALPTLAAEVALHYWLQSTHASAATSDSYRSAATTAPVVHLPTVSKPGLDAVFATPASCLTFFHHVHASGHTSSGGNSSSLPYSSAVSMPGMAAVADLISSASALESEVSLRELTFDAGAAKQQLEAAMVAGDLDAGFSQLAACMGESAAGRVLCSHTRRWCGILRETQHQQQQAVTEMHQLIC
jgi:hypothetical protein